LHGRTKVAVTNKPGRQIGLRLTHRRRGLDAAFALRRDPLQEMFDAVFEWMERETDARAEQCAHETIVNVQRMHDALRDVNFERREEKEQQGNRRAVDHCLAYDQRGTD